MGLLRSDGRRSDRRGRRPTSTPVADEATGVPSLQVVVAGISSTKVCGVRDHARILTSALEDRGVKVTSLWVEAPSGASGVTELVRSLRRQTRAEQPDAVLLHYSVFAYAWRGLPLGVPLLAMMLRRLNVRSVLFAHEFAYPWGRRGWRGAVHAATQRAALAPLVAASSAVVVTTRERVLWLRTRWWLPQRPMACAPVFSNISPHPSSRSIAPVPGRVGLFSFGAEGLAVEIVTGAVAEVAKRSPRTHLVLIGAPGPDSPAGEHWRMAAQVVGCPLAFTGVGEEAAVSRELAACQLVVFADPAGPSSRKTSLAAALVHGRAVVALDGPQRSEEFVDARSVVVVEPSVEALAAELTRLLADDVARLDLGARALKFAHRRVSASQTAAIVISVVEGSAPWGRDGLLLQRASRRAPRR